MRGFCEYAEGESLMGRGGGKVRPAMARKAKFAQSSVIVVQRVGVDGDRNEEEEGADCVIEMLRITEIATSRWDRTFGAPGSPGGPGGRGILEGRSRGRSGEVQARVVMSPGPA